MSNQSVTTKIFQFIESKFFSEKKNMLDEVGELLHLQKSTVYKKMKGESTLSLDEAEILCRHFRISLDEVLGIADDKIYFDFPSLYGSVANEKEFLDPIRGDLEKLYRLDPIIYYATKELPLFYYFISPKLIAFKFNVFYNFVWKKKEDKLVPFDYSLFENNSEFISNVNKVLELYSSMNSIEIWNTAVLDNTFNQLKYFLESGLMVDPKESLLLCDELEKLIHILEQLIHSKDKSALRKKSINTGKFELYNNEIAHTNNVIFVKSKTRDAVYCTYDNPNFMRSISPVLCEYTEKWFDKLILNSVSISNGNMKEQSQFINKLKEKLQRARLAIQSSLQHMVD
ncbi:MAG: helix-turn-helix transcriptional regulator [Saprospiraceae bacterium]|nr:helix-turn-helix transcriptional regulator [Saprospiraceae bacterium]